MEIPLTCNLLDGPNVDTFYEQGLFLKKRRDWCSDQNPQLYENPHGPRPPLLLIHRRIGQQIGRRRLPRRRIGRRMPPRAAPESAARMRGRAPPARAAPTRRTHFAWKLMTSAFLIFPKLAMHVRSLDLAACLTPPGDQIRPGGVLKRGGWGRNK